MAPSPPHLTIPLLIFLLALQHSLHFVLPSSNAYIVYMGEKTREEPQLLQELHHGILSTVLESEEAAGSSILYSYNYGFSGFAAVLSETQAGRIADFPGVVRVIPNRILGLHTTRSWDFLRLNPTPSDGILSRSNSGDGSIVGVLDTGIWPESGSFNDHGMGEVPTRWKGICQEGEEFHISNCNRKIVGARWYIKGYQAEFGKLNTSDMVEFLSPRDAVGHGTHTSSTIVGALVSNASFLGLARGIARGGASKARLAIYKVCWATGDCSSADILAAFDDAIHDGVDVLSVSLGSSPPLPTYVDDVLAMGSFHAVARGITVVCSAGNSGPFSQTVINTAPWIITVAASTIDRTFFMAVTLGNNLTFAGQAPYLGKHVGRFYQIVYAEDIASDRAEDVDARSCNAGSLNESLARGNVVLCFQTRNQRSPDVAAKTVRRAHGVGLIFAQFMTKDIPSISGFPCVQVDFETGTSILTYLGNTRRPVVRFSSTRTAVGKVISPEVAYFSSRGPSSLSPSVLKPDITAPGVNILASWSPVASSSSNLGPLNFMIESGTSMSCPHISAIAALIKSIHPNWSPAAIKSALVTTASVDDEYGLSLVAEGAPHKPANPFDYGGGHVDPNRAIDPGLIYDMGLSNYVNFLCSMGYNDSAVSSMTQQHTVCHEAPESEGLNLPSILIPALRKRLTVSRTVTNIAPVTATYIARVEAPPGVIVNVRPSVLSFNSTISKLRFEVIFRSRLKVQGRYSFGSLSWEDGIHSVRIPLVVRTVVSDIYPDA